MRRVAGSLPALGCNSLLLGESALPLVSSGNDVEGLGIAGEILSGKGPKDEPPEKSVWCFLQLGWTGLRPDSGGWLEHGGILLEPRLVDYLSALVRRWIDRGIMILVSGRARGEDERKI